MNRYGLKSFLVASTAAIAIGTVAFALRGTSDGGALVSISVASAAMAGLDDCVSTQGFWKNHPDAWPVDWLELGNLTYDQDELLAILDQKVRGNGLVSLAYQMIAARLNEADGATVPPEVQDALSGADALMSGLLVPPIGDGYLSPHETNEFRELLDAYNNGDAPDGPISCDDDDGGGGGVPPCEGEPLSCTDLNGDGEVDACDLALLLAGWGFSPGHPADCNADGFVGAIELIVMLGSWTGGLPLAEIQACIDQFLADGDVEAVVACVEPFCNCQ